MYKIFLFFIFNWSKSTCTPAIIPAQEFVAVKARGLCILNVGCFVSKGSISTYLKYSDVINKTVFIEAPTVCTGSMHSVTTHLYGLGSPVINVVYK